MPDRHVLEAAELAGIPAFGCASAWLPTVRGAEEWDVVGANITPPDARYLRTLSFYALDHLIHSCRTLAADPSLGSGVVHLLDDARVFGVRDVTPIEGCVGTTTVTFGPTTADRWRPNHAARVVEGDLSLSEVLDELEVAATKKYEPKAFAALKDLRRWLRLSVAEAAELVGFGRTTPSSWVRAGNEPQPARARRLYQTHAIISAMVRRFGEDETLHWFLSGSPSPRAFLLQGDIEAAADSAERLLIGRQRRPGPAVGALLEDGDVDQAAPATLRPTVRRRNRRKTP